jgi:hypothetical protein
MIETKTAHPPDSDRETASLLIRNYASSQDGHSIRSCGSMCVPPFRLGTSATTRAAQLPVRCIGGHVDPSGQVLRDVIHWHS